MTCNVEIFATFWLPLSRYQTQGEAVWLAIQARKATGANTRVFRSDGRLILWPKGQAPRGYEHTA